MPLSNLTFLYLLKTTSSQVVTGRFKFEFEYEFVYISYQETCSPCSVICERNPAWKT